MKFDLRDPLSAIDPATCSYDEWLQVGMALQHEGYPYEVWEEWSRNDSARFHEGECARKWKSFQGNPDPVTGATITQMAKTRGWSSKKKSEPDRALEWDSMISDVQIVDTHYLEAEKEIKEPENWDQLGDMIAYLNAIFLPDDIVAVSMQSYEKDGRYVPSAGMYQLTAGHFVEQLKKYKLKAQKGEMSTNDAIGYAMGDYDPNAGAWIRFNPFDGQGVKNINVADYRYALVESDSMAPGLQEELIRKMELPVVALVFSGKNPSTPLSTLMRRTWRSTRNEYRSSTTSASITALWWMIMTVTLPDFPGCRASIGMGTNSSSWPRTSARRIMLSGWNGWKVLMMTCPIRKAWPVYGMICRTWRLR